MTTLPDSTNLLYGTYRKKTIPLERKVRIDIEQVYKMKCMRSKEDADVNYGRYMLEKENYGIGSAYIQTQYFCSFDIRGERFVTINRLEELGVIKQDLKLHMDNLYNSIPQHMRHKYYKIGAIDSARHSDIAAFTAGLLYVDFDIASGINSYRVYATDFVIINEAERNNGEIISPTTLTQKSSDLCQAYKLDMLMYDTTGNQDDRAYYLYKTNMNRKIGTLIIPYSYASSNKQIMFEKLEDSIDGTRVYIPSLDEEDRSTGYKEFLTELKVFKKEVNGNKISYSAPTANGVHDDFVTAFAQLNFIPYYIEKCDSDFVTANLATDANYRLTWKRYDEDNLKNVKRITSYGFKY